jgi:hypothetical protein
LPLLPTKPSPLLPTRTHRAMPSLKGTLLSSFELQENPYGTGPQSSEDLTPKRKGAPEQLSPLGSQTSQATMPTPGQQSPVEPKTPQAAMLTPKTESMLPQTPSTASPAPESLLTQTGISWFDAAQGRPASTMVKARQDLIKSRQVPQGNDQQGSSQWANAAKRMQKAGTISRATGDPEQFV